MATSTGSNNKPTDDPLARLRVRTPNGGRRRQTPYPHEALAPALGFSFLSANPLGARNSEGPSPRASLGICCFASADWPDRLIVLRCCRFASRLKYVPVTTASTQPEAAAPN